jgi:tetratricopeptide (TPR) repeat protein
MRQAEEAIASGRLEEAQRLLNQPGARGHRGASTLLRQVAQKLIDRGRHHLNKENPEAAWKDLLQAETIEAADPATAQLRQALTRLGLVEARKLVDAGEPARALEVLRRLNAEGNPQADLQLLDELTRGWVQARELAGRGELGLALETVERLRQLLPRPPAALERFRSELIQRRPAFTHMLVQLHEAWANEHWPEVVRYAEQLLTIAPHHVEARKARARAWKALEPTTKVAGSVPHDEAGQRFLLWVDGVGGFLVCLANRVTVGQAAPDAYVDVPLLADVSRTHAALTRDAEGYVVEAIRKIKVNGNAMEKALLQSGDRLTLGSTCQFQFRQPVPVSATARLDLVSGHRLPVSVEAVILMAETLILGPGTQAHVTVPGLQQNLVLYRAKEGLGIRCPGNLIVDGKPFKDRALLGPTSHVKGDDFAFAVEPIGARL